MNARARLGVALLVVVPLSIAAIAGASSLTTPRAPAHVGEASSATKPGTPAQVAHLVAVSHSITKVSQVVAAQLTDPKLRPENLYPVVAHGCDTTGQCVFGKRTSKHVVVLFGDSHALMWLPALDWAMRQDRERLVLLWAPACPAADLTGFVYRGEIIPPNSKCTAWRARAVRAIVKLRPKAVLIGERTAGVAHSDGSSFTTAQWSTALQVTIHRLQSKATKMAVLEDIVFMDSLVPQCLAAYPTAVQTCSSPNPNLPRDGQEVAERAAAKATGATFIATRHWLCTTRCSPIVGDMVTYYNWSHVSAPYSAFLAEVMRTAVAKVLA